MFKLPLFFTLLCELCLLVLSRIYPESSNDWQLFYKDNFRSLLFSGFLTVGSFLFAVKAFIIIRLKEGIFDQEWFLDEHAQDVVFHDACIDDYLIQLKNLTSLLFYSILYSISTSLLHLTLGLYPHFIPSLICISFSVFSVALIVFTLVQIKRNFDSWFKALDKIYRAKLEMKETALRASLSADPHQQGSQEGAEGSESAAS